MERINLLTTQKLTQYGFINGNVEEDIILNTAWRVQETQIQPILGSPLYNALLEKIKDWATNGYPASTDDYYVLLIEYVIPCFIPLVEFKITFHTSTQIENKGTGTNSDEYMRTGSASENNNLRDELKKDASVFRNQLIKFLCDDNGDLYPEYIERTGKKVDMLPTDTRPDYESKLGVI